MVWDKLKTELGKITADAGLRSQPLAIRCAPLTPEEAIGRPEDGDYALQKGKERMVEAEFLGAKGQAFSNMFGRWQGSVDDVVNMELDNDFRRAVFVASLNAVMRHLGLIEGTIHCRDDGPRKCAREAASIFADELPPGSRITMVGYQPRLFEVLSERHKVTCLDLAPENVGKTFCGSIVAGPDETARAMEGAQGLMVTGTTLVNDTIGQFLDTGKPTVFYGVTIAGAAKLLGLRRFCPCGE